MISYTNTNTGASATLRPMLASKLAAKTGTMLPEDKTTRVCDAGNLAIAARAVRDSYRCRTARRDLNRIAVVAGWVHNKGFTDTGSTVTVRADAS